MLTPSRHLRLSDYHTRDVNMPQHDFAPSPAASSDYHRDSAVLHQLLLETGLPTDIAASLPASQLTEALRKLGIAKVGHRQRILALLHQRAAAAINDDAPSSSSSTANPSAPLVIPRRLFTFWFDGHASELNPKAPKARAAADAELVRCCIARMRLCHPSSSWDVRVLRVGDADLPPPPVPVDTLSGAQLADWYRLAALAEYGGVYLDATCITLQPVDSWVDLSSRAITGFCLVSDLDTMESWAIAAPPKSPFLLRWRDEFAEALRPPGPAAYCASLPGSLISRGLREALPYLTIHACWQKARASFAIDGRRGGSQVGADDAPRFVLRSPVEAGGPYRYLAEATWDSPQAVVHLFGKDVPALRATPLIKLRGRERDSIAPLASYGRASALSRALLGASAPQSVAERLALVRVGVDPDIQPAHANDAFLCGEDLLVPRAAAAN